MAMALEAGIEDRCVKKSLQDAMDAHLIENCLRYQY